MFILKKASQTVLLSVFSVSILFADNEPINLPQILHNQKVEELEDVEAPPPPPALIDLNQKKEEKKSGAKYSGLYLFLFNITMFTTGMIVVKQITGKKA